VLLERRPQRCCEGERGRTKIFCRVRIDEARPCHVHPAQRLLPSAETPMESAIQEIKLDRKFDDKNVASFIDSERSKQVRSTGNTPLP
jgi:hypothetical protein